MVYSHRCTTCRKYSEDRCEYALMRIAGGCQRGAPCYEWEKKVEGAKVSGKTKTLNPQKLTPQKSTRGGRSVKASADPLP
jgi:hypothetical protein